MDSNTGCLVLSLRRTCVARRKKEVSEARKACRVSSTRSSIVATPSGPIRRWPNGMVNSVNHYNNVTDTYAKDPVDIRRPAAISFGQFGGCALPQITGQPQGQTIASGQPATLQVSATGTNLTYQWYMDPYDAVARHYTVIPGAISSSYTTSPVYTTRYMVS